MNIQFLGFMGAAIMALSAFPQVIHSYKSKSTKEISCLWKACFLIGKFIYIIYLFNKSSLPIVIFISAEATMTAFLFILKIIYNLKK